MLHFIVSDKYTPVFFTRTIVMVLQSDDSTGENETNITDCSRPYSDRCLVSWHISDFRWRFEQCKYIILGEHKHSDTEKEGRFREFPLRVNVKASFRHLVSAHCYYILYQSEQTQYI